MEFNRLLSQVISDYGEPIEKKFENSFSKLIGTKFAIGVNSGTDAIKLN